MERHRIVEQQKDTSKAGVSSEKRTAKDFGGAPANAFFIPVVVVIALLHVIVIMLMFSIFAQSSKLSQANQNSSTYISEATSLMSGTSLLSETSSNYVLKPVNAQGEPSIGALIAYANELGQTDHRGDEVLAHFETYDVSDEVLDRMQDAVESANALLSLQNHALALTCAVYPPPDNPALSSLELPELTADEAALPDEKKIELAQSLVLDEEWGTNKQSVTSNVKAASADIRATTGEQTREASQTIGLLRTLLIAASITILLFLCFSFIMFYRLFISPLGKFSHLIVEGDSLNENHGLREMRLLAGSYNDLLHRRDTLEGILREAAETDTLTGLPNRYSMQQDRLEAPDEGYALAVFLFDVDYLKQTNDKLGHAAGDDLIKRAAHCISTCFASTDDGRCYRMAGDEFAALVKNIDESEIQELAESFEEMQKQNDVSISWGYAYAEDIGNASFRSLMDEADRRMYEMKETAHSEGNRKFRRPGMMRCFREEARQLS